VIYSAANPGLSVGGRRPWGNGKGCLLSSFSSRRLRKGPSVKKGPLWGEIRGQRLRVGGVEKQKKETHGSRTVTVVHHAFIGTCQSSGVEMTDVKGLNGCLRLRATSETVSDWRLRLGCPCKRDESLPFGGRRMVYYCSVA
jgi:hypothetical protein